MPIDPEIVVNGIANGLSIRDAARHYELSEAEIRAILKRATDECYDGIHLREQWMLEARRLQAVGLKFFHKAMDEGDPQAAIVFIKASERAATLAGANAPTGHAVSVIDHTAALEQPTSTQRIRRVLDELIAHHAPPRDEPVANPDSQSRDVLPKLE